MANIQPTKFRLDERGRKVALKGARWRARYRDLENKTQSKTFDRKIDAERFLTSTEHGKLSGTYVDPTAGRITLKEYAERRREMQVHRPSTAAQLETNLRR